MEPAPSWKRMVSFHAILDPEEWSEGMGEYGLKITMEIVHREEDPGPTPPVMAAWADDNLVGHFAFRDHTIHGTSFIAEGETYWSEFVFQYRVDAWAFHQRWRMGRATWEPGYDAWCDQAEERRAKMQMDEPVPVV